MNKLWDTLGMVLFLVGLFLVLYYFEGTKTVLSTATKAVTDTVNALQGKDALGRLPATYPR